VTLRTNSRLKPKRRTTRTTTRGLSFLAGSAAHVS
jgi:hypothetical protein